MLADLTQEQRLLDEHRLAYIAEVPVNWCPALGTVLANEEVTNEGRSERGDHPVYRRAAAAVDAADHRLRRAAARRPRPGRLARVDQGHAAQLDRPQRGGRGRFPRRQPSAIADRSRSASAGFRATRAGRHPSSPPAPTRCSAPPTWCSRPSTRWSSRHHDARAAGRRSQAYVEQAGRKSELERTAETKEKTGVFTGAYAVNPVNGETIPIWVADYVLMGYGTGAIMAVPGARRARLRVRRRSSTCRSCRWSSRPTGVGRAATSFVDDGIGRSTPATLDGLPTTRGQDSQIDAPGSRPSRARAGAAVNYKLRDWLFSRQRYWGEPFPIVHCADVRRRSPCRTTSCRCVLPDARGLQARHRATTPTRRREPPLGQAHRLGRRPRCPSCGEPAQRETNTMPQWAGSCWYYLRYLDPKNDAASVDRRPSGTG